LIVKKLNILYIKDNSRYNEPLNAYYKLTHYIEKEKYEKNHPHSLILKTENHDNEEKPKPFLKHGDHW
jgi:hypothetical protein